jgi:hypothetical protein
MSCTGPIAIFCPHSSPARLTSRSLHPGQHLKVSPAPATRTAIIGYRPVLAHHPQRATLFVLSGW